jgi:regulatory protein
MDRQALEAARAVAFRFLGYAARSRAEIERRLAKADFEPDVIEAVVAELEARKWIDDAQFAQDWVADRADRKLYGRGRLAAELRTRGVDRESVDAALETVNEEAELSRARAALDRKWRTETLPALEGEALQAEKRRLANFLQRRGFSWHIITQVLAERVVNNE